MSSDIYEKAIVDIKKYDSNADEALVAALSKNYAIVMRKKDSSAVACSDKKELLSVKTNFLKKKLGLTITEDEMDAALKDVCITMKDSRMKSRITVYYLLTKKFSKESVFI